MAVTKADKVAELELLEQAFKGTESAVVVDFKGLKVPEVTELRRQIRGAKGSYKVVKNTLARRAMKGTRLRGAGRALPRHDRRRLQRRGPGPAGQGAHHVREDGAGAEDQGGGGAGPVDQGRRGQRAGDDAGQAGALREAPVRAPGADGADRERSQRRAARPDERVGQAEQKSRKAELPPEGGSDSDTN